MVRCRDGSLYTGITLDVNRRVAEHNGSVRGARYTRSRRPVVLVLASLCGSRSKAAKREFCIKSLSKWQKEILVAREEL